MIHYGKFYNKPLRRVDEKGLKFVRTNGKKGLEIIITSSEEAFKIVKTRWSWEMKGKGLAPPSSQIYKGTSSLLVNDYNDSSTI